ncbi:MAG: hypothetical protein KDA37_17205, partial [Planctomycetales bacterium]|nr:hypothetical protein [Planctomycetales bacterium]
MVDSDTALNFSGKAPTAMDSRTKTKNRRGAMLPLIAIALPVVVVLLGFAVDLAFMQLTRLELQAVTDAAA